MPITLLPADEYIVIQKTILTEYDRKNLVSYYEPIIGSFAVSLYFTFWRDLERYQKVKTSYSHHHLMTILKAGLDQIKESRKALEAMGLLRTYVEVGEPNHYVYELYSPMSPKEFFANPIFNVVLYNNIGASEYELLKKEYAYPSFSLKEYQEITTSFDHVFSSYCGENYAFESFGREVLPLQFENQIDFDLLLSSLPKGIINEKTFTKRTKELIQQLSFIYNLDTLKMCEILRLSVNEKGAIDKENLRVQTRKYYQYNHQGKLPTLVYRTQPEYLRSPKGDTSKKGRIIEVFETTSPYDFLKSKYKNTTPTSRDLRLLENLIVDLELKPAVVNVLIDYVLKKNNNKLNTAFVETIAGQWKRLGIETAKDAMEVAEKEHKKYVNKLSKVSSKPVSKEMPVWFDETIGKEQMSEEEESELASILEKYKD